MHTEDRIEDEAARWMVDIDGGPLSAEQRRALDEWLNLSEAHRAALARQMAVWDGAEVLRGTPMRTDPCEALAGRSWWSRAMHAFATKPDFTLICACVLGVVGVVAYVGYSSLKTEHIDSYSYSTRIGKHDRQTLMDGTSVDLNTNTSLIVSFSRSQRNVTLIRGEALFQVAHDEQRPFRVVAGGVVVQAVGTDFAVAEDKERRVIVLVSDGTVKVSEKAQTQRVLTNVTGGQRLVVYPNGKIEPATLGADEVKRRLEWVNGRLQFTGQTLAEAVAEFNKFNTTQIIVADPELAAYKIGGTFDPTDIEGFVSALILKHGVRKSYANTDGSEIHLSAPARKD